MTYSTESRATEGDGKAWVRRLDSADFGHVFWRWPFYNSTHATFNFLAICHPTHAHNITFRYDRTSKAHNFTFPLPNITAFLKMNRLFAASLLVARGAILLTTPIAAAGEAVLAEDPTHGQETFYAIGRQLSKGPPPKVRFRLHVLMC